MPDHTLTVRIEDATDPRVTAAIEAELRRRVDAIRYAQDAAVVRYLRSFGDTQSRRHADRIEAGHHRPDYGGAERPDLDAVRAPAARQLGPATRIPDEAGLAALQACIDAAFSNSDAWQASIPAQEDDSDLVASRWVRQLIEDRDNALASAAVACETPADHCDCPGCALAAELMGGGS